MFKKRGGMLSMDEASGLGFLGLVWITHRLILGYRWRHFNLTRVYKMDAPQAATAYQFVMDRWTPATIPMKRLAQYLEKLANLIGRAEHVHFTKITKGSAMPAWNVSEVAAADVAASLQATNEGTSPDGVKTREEINRMLMDDDCVAYIRELNGPKVMEFLGRKTPIRQEVTVHEIGELEGMVIRVGGRDASVPVHLQGAGGEYYTCQTTRVIAKQLAPLLFDKQVRVSGKGKWRRNAEGVWNLEDFLIMEFQLLDDVSLEGFIKDMRAIPGSAWNEMEDPQAELKRIRGD